MMGLIREEINKWQVKNNIVTYRYSARSLKEEKMYSPFAGRGELKAGTFRLISTTHIYRVHKIKGGTFKNYNDKAYFS